MCVRDIYLMHQVLALPIMHMILSHCTVVDGVTNEVAASCLGNCGLISVVRYCGFMFVYRLKHTAMFRIITADGAVWVL